MKKTDSKIDFKDIGEFPSSAISSFDMRWNRTGSWRYLRPIYVNRTPPCNNGCPSNEDIEGWIRLVSEGRYGEALGLIRIENPFPSICGRVCFHPCERGCNRKNSGGAVSINALERFVADVNGIPRPPEPFFGRNGVRAAVVGSGPAGMSCAFHLARLGFSVTIFEKRSYTGGVLRYGIPSHRLPKKIIDGEFDCLRDMGVEIVTGSDAAINDLKKDFFRVFVAIGAGESKRLGVEGDDSEGVISGLEFLESVYKGSVGENPGRVVVVGGGNTAVDAARTAVRLGAESVKILYRRSRVEMPAFEEEVREAEEEGVELHILAAPSGVVVEEGARKWLRCVRMELGEPDSSGRRKPVPVKDSEFTLECDLIISAIGEDVMRGDLPEEILFEKGSVRTGFDMRTSDPAIFSGGDMIDLPRTVVDAIASGKRAAIAIDCDRRGISFAEIGDRIKGSRNENVSMSKYVSYLGGRANHRATGLAADIQDIAGIERMNLNYFDERQRNPRGHVPLDKRLGRRNKDDRFVEVVLPLPEKTALKEAERCFHCGRCTECDNCFIFCPDVSIAPAQGGYGIDYGFCKGCGLCVKECPRGAMMMIEEPSEEDL